MFFDRSALTAVMPAEAGSQATNHESAENCLGARLRGRDDREIGKVTIYARWYKSVVMIRPGSGRVLIQAAALSGYPVSARP
jgi:hypothetical protein